MKIPGKKYFFLELTNHCNFSCTFCPDEIMTRSRKFMDKNLALRLIAEIAKKRLTDEPLQLHLMGEPLLYPHLSEVIVRIHSRGLAVRLFTNGALLDEKNRKLIFGQQVEELVIGIHTFNEQLYLALRRGKPGFTDYLARIRDTIEDKFRKGSATKIFLQYLNTKHYNRSRVEKGYQETVIPLVDDDRKAFQVIEEWKEYGRSVSKNYGLEFEPQDLECLQGRFKLAPLDCLKGNHCEILPGVILHFKDISTFSDYLMRKVRFVERYNDQCQAIEEQLAVLSNGDCTPCCVDYEGSLAVGNVGSQSLESILQSNKYRRLVETNRQGLLPAPLCRTCQAILVEDDYQKKFPGDNQAGYRLEHGWYPLERETRDLFRWTGKRAALTLEKDGKEVAFEVKNSHPRLERMRVSIQQGKRKRTYRLKGRSWQTLAFKLSKNKKPGTKIVLESGDLWIPAEHLENNQDQRELGVMVRSIKIIADS